MIIDEILDRKDGCRYNVKTFYTYVKKEESIFELGTEISKAIESGNNSNIQKALCNYITEQEYNPDICNYVNSVDWLESDPVSDEIEYITDDDDDYEYCSFC